MLKSFLKSIGGFFLYVFEEVIDNGKTAHVNRSEPRFGNRNQPIDDTDLPTIRLD